MASLFESFSSAINPEIVSALGKALGADTSAIHQGLSAAAPLLMGSMTELASTPSGAESLLKMLPQDTGGLMGGFGSLTSLISNLFSGGPTGNSLLSSLLGPGLNAIAGSLTKALGFNVMPLLSMTAPALMGLISKKVKSEKLDATSLADVLKRETAQFTGNPANATAVKLANEAIAAGDKAVLVITSYGDDWKKVAAAPVAAMLAVSSSDLDGPFDTMKEVKAAQAALLGAARAAPSGSVLAAAFGGGLTKSALKSVRAMAKDRSALTRLIAEATTAVKQRSPGDLEAFKATIRSVGRATAEAAKEGGFLGIGGTLVSHAEKAALVRIEAAIT